MQALIIIDMQQSPFSQTDKYDAAGVIHRINLLAQKTREKNDAVVFIQHDGTLQEGLAPGTTGWEIIPSLQPQAGDIVIRKTTNDAFYKTHLEDFLQENNISDLFFCGWATDFCVDTSIKAAISRDYKVTVVADCHTLSDRDKLGASVLINYYNELWGKMLSQVQAVKVTKAAQIY
ncbi:MAG: cysteine hydrolase [Oceanospirillaceae bacterium]|nr:cysteine hydrolase [Oceanospirillaceae bacterium]